MVGDGGGEAMIENNRHRLPHHLHETYAAVVTSPVQDQDHHMLTHLLHGFSFPELRLDQLHHHLPFILITPLLPVLSPVLGSSSPPSWIRHNSFVFRF